MGAGNEMIEYGSLAEIVKNVGILLAAVLAISLGWMKRHGSQWIPPDEAVPKATTRTASLITAVLLAFLYAFLRQPERIIVLAILTFLSLITAVSGHLYIVYLLKRYGFEVEGKTWFGKKIKRIKLGGSKLTHDAIRAREVRKVDVDRLFEESGGVLEAVFTKQSIAKIHTTVSAVFLIFQSFGSLALGGAGLLLSTASV